MKRLIGWLANFYPKHFFYASDFGKDWDLRIPDGQSDTPHQTIATTALLGVAVAVGKNIPVDGGEMIATFTNVTDGGNEIGSFRVTVERIESKEGQSDE